jgi:hypothetical protein
MLKFLLDNIFWYLWWTCFSTNSRHTYGYKLCSSSRRLVPLFVWGYLKGKFSNGKIRSNYLETMEVKHKVFVSTLAILFYEKHLDQLSEYVIQLRVEKSNVLMLLQEERDVYFMYSNRSSEFFRLHIWFTSLLDLPNKITSTKFLC